jgi:hypothetical protein
VPQTFAGGNLSELKQVLVDSGIGTRSARGRLTELSATTGAMMPAAVTVSTLADPVARIAHRHQH